MGNRITEFFEENIDYPRMRLAAVEEEIAEAIARSGGQFVEEFKAAFDDVFQRCVKMQAAGEKAPIAFVCVSKLRSSLMTKTYDVRIDLYDKNFYLDRSECAGKWRAAFAFEPIQEDCAYFTKCARTKLVRIQAAEMKIFLQEFQDVYFEILEEFCARHIKMISKLASWNAVMREEPVTFSFGDFLDAGVTLEID